MNDRNIKMACPNLKIISITFLLLVAVFPPVADARTSAVSTHDIHQVTIFPTPTYDPGSSRESDDGITILNLTETLTWYNDVLFWGFSADQISEYSDNLTKNAMGNYSAGSRNYHVKNFTIFSEYLRDSIGITEEQRLALLYDDNKQMGYRIQYLEIPGFTPPETPHFRISGRITDSEGRPVPDAVVKFESNLTVENVSLSSTTRSNKDGGYNLSVVWGNRQNASIIKEGFITKIRSGINLSYKNTTIDFPLTRQPAPSPGFVVPAGIGAIVVVSVILVRGERKR